MSDIILHEDSDLLAEMAAELGIDINEEENLHTGRIYTNLTTIENIRVVKSKSWQDGEAFTWNYPGEEYTEEFGDDFPIIHELEGFIVHSELQPALSVKNDDPESDRVSRTICSVVGYRKGESYIKDLPERIYFNTMYDGWDSANKRPVYTKPTKAVEALGLLGSRYKSCADCIRCGESVEIDQESGEVLGECSLRGRIFFYVTDLVRYKKTMPKGGGEPKVERVKKSISELLEGENGILLMINLPNKVGLKGKWDKKDETKRRNSYLPYLTGLYYKYKDKKDNSVFKMSPRMVATKLSIKPPVGDDQNTKNFLEFTEIEPMDLAKRKLAKEAWDAIKPQKEIELLNADDWLINGKGGQTVFSTASVDSTPILEPAHVEAVEEQDPDDIPF